MRVPHCHQLWHANPVTEGVDDVNFGSRQYAGRVGLDADSVGGHSLRAGFLTEAAGSGASIAKMQEVSRQKKVEVLLGYVRSAELFEDHAGKGFL